MKLITRDTDYALRSICFMAKNKNRIISVSELVKALKIPRPFLRKVLQTLNRKGILYSYKGLGGGFKLALPAKKIFLINLMKIFQGPFRLNECLFKKRICPQRYSCALKKRIDRIEKYVVSNLKAITIANLLKT
jgi:Rrf2 family protein